MFAGQCIRGDYKATLKFSYDILKHTAYHATIGLNGQTTLVTEMHRGRIPLTYQIELENEKRN